MNARIRAIGLVVALLVSACYDGGVICTAEGRSSFALEIRDSISGAGGAGQATTTVVDGAFADTLWKLDSVYQGGLFERAGTYVVTVSAAGYQPWTKSDVVVEQGECHVETVSLLVRLQPE